MSLKTSNLLIVVSILIILSMIFHAVIPHHHPKEIFGDGIQGAFHGEEKKYYTLIVLASLFFAFSGFFRKRLYVDSKHFISAAYFSLISDFSKIFDPIRETLRRGIVHPKLCY